ncbi:hypothetical protein VPNG_08098 [Cytospora leucostoma]|uniref:Uncharacterized protein n=1 Tax=Cytospora leucostoma TaxID=1230097 RepID=A0A423WSI2_9PEZI|nr:hypothetical protein VPNG_08098 [Cytospora leucostoma]
MAESITTARGAATSPNADEDDKNEQSRNLIYLERVMDVLKGAAEGSDGNDLAHLVVQEPDTPLLIASCIMPLTIGWYFDHIKMRNKERKTALYNLYNKLLKPRAHCFLELYRVEIILDDDSFQEAHRGGLFGFGRDKPEAVINADDTGALKKYMDLMGPFSYQREPDTSLDLGIWGLLRRGGCEQDTRAHCHVVSFVRALAEAVCGRECSRPLATRVSNEIELVVGDDGELNKEHPLVPGLGLGYPTSLSYDPGREQRLGDNFSRNIDLPPEAYVHVKGDVL